MKLLLDTHIFLWWYLDRPELSKKYGDILQSAEQGGEEIGLSVISLWEITKLVSLGRLKISFSLDQWFEEMEEDTGLSLFPLNGRIILESSRLGEGFPRDPADQLIAATARCHELRLMTADQRIISSGVVAIA